MNEKYYIYSQRKNFNAFALFDCNDLFNFEIDMFVYT